MRRESRSVVFVFHMYDYILSQHYQLLYDSMKACVKMNYCISIFSDTVDGWNPKQPPWMYKTLVYSGTKYQPQLVSRISAINSSMCTIFISPHLNFSQVRCDLVVGADGLKSRLRSQLLGDGAPRHHGRREKKHLLVETGWQNPRMFRCFFWQILEKEPEDLGRNDLNLDEDLCRWGEHTN